MTWAYFDSSALVKRYVDEPGRRDILELLRRHHCVTSVVMPIELRSALRRRVAENEIERSGMAEILRRFARDRTYWAFVAVTDDVVTAAETLVAAHPLRTLDAIHVASARFFAAHANVSDLVFVSADARQTAAASAIGISTHQIGSR